MSAFEAADREVGVEVTVEIFLCGLCLRGGGNRRWGARRRERCIIVV